LSDPSAVAPFAVVNDGGVAEEIPGSVAGAMLDTPAGRRPVERIGIGDILCTLRPGGVTEQPVMWGGHRTINVSRHPPS
jgi:hypothetical protein